MKSQYALFKINGDFAVFKRSGRKKHYADLENFSRFFETEKDAWDYAIFKTHEQLCILEDKFKRYEKNRKESLTPIKPYKGKKPNKSK